MKIFFLLLLNHSIYNENDGQLKALMPYYDIKLIQLMKQSFEREFSTMLKSNSGATFSKMKLSPSIKISKQRSLQSRLVKTSNNTAFLNLIKTAQLDFRMHILKRTMMQEPEARVISFSGKQTARGRSFSPLCLK